MAKRAEWTVEGLNELVRTLKKLGLDSSDMKAAFTRIGNIVVNEAKTLVPVRSGRLSNTIKASNTQNKSIVRAGSAAVPYAGVIHYGGYHGIEPHPYLTSAIEREETAIDRSIEDELFGLIRKAGLQ